MYFRSNSTQIITKDKEARQRDRQPARTCEWMVESMAFRKALGFSASSKPWTGRNCFRGLGLPKTARVLDLLDLCVMAKLNKESPSEEELTAGMSGVLLDVSQSFGRNATTNKEGVSHALTTGSCLSSFDRDSVLTGREMLQMHGQPKSLRLPSDLAESHVVHLAGEGMALPCLASVIWVLYLCKQFPEI